MSRLWKRGADYIATGHYARVDGKNLLRAEDENKDQTYFLYRISEEAIAHTLFPIGGMKKPEVKKLASERGLDNAYKKESMGVCFVGEVGMKDFLREYIEVKPGKIIDKDSGEVLGYHDGAIFYTIGQRHGLYVGGGLPYYVVDKDIEKNIVYVSKNLNNDNLWTKELELGDVILRDCSNDFLGARSSRPSSRGSAALPSLRSRVPRGERQQPPDPLENHYEQSLLVRLRHRAPLIPAKFDGKKLIFEKAIKRPAAGQSAVLYKDQICLGGGIIK